MENQQPAVIAEESNLVAMPQITGERSLWSLMRDQAQVLVKSGMLPASVKSAEAAMAIMQTGREFGLQPMQSFRVIHIIEGKPTLSAQFMAALVNRHCTKHGGYLRQIELTDQRCVIEYKRPEWPAPQTFSFSMEDAKRAQLAGKGNWTKHPREMMCNRAVANACRMGWPELVAGVYDRDELEAAGADYSVAYSFGQERPGQIIDLDGSVMDLESGEIVGMVTDGDQNRDRAAARYFAVAAAKGLTTDVRRELQRLAYGVESSKELSANQLRQLADRFEERSLEELHQAIWISQQAREDPPPTEDPEPVPAFDPASPVPDFLARIETAQDADALYAVTAELQAIGVWAPEITTAVAAKRLALGLPGPDATKGTARTVNDIVAQVPVATGDPGNDNWSR